MRDRIREQIAWAAGFFDGEGSITVRRQHERSVQVFMNVSQVDRRSLVRLSAALGIGSILGPYIKQARHEGRVQPIYQWHATGFEHTQAAIAKLWEFLGEAKRDQARTALTVAAAVKRRRKTHCRRGHEYEASSRRRDGSMCCGPCKRVTDKAYRQRRRDARVA